MKLLFFFAILFIFFLQASFAQAPPDDDKDGIPNSEDVCPTSPGTKANKGCPDEKGTSTTEFINSEVLTKLLNAICSNILPSLASNQKDGNLTVSNLPLIGKQKNLPIMFNVFPNGTAEIYCILSPTNSDLQEATNEILNKLKSGTFCNKILNNAFLNYRKDTTVIIIPPVAGNKYYEMALEVPKGSTVVVLHILDYNRVITKEEVENYNTLIKPKNAVNDKEAEFCRKLKDVVSDFSSGFSLLKWEATEDTLFGFGDTYKMKETYLPFFTERETFNSDKDFQEFSYFEATIGGLKEIDAQKLLDTFEKRIESCFNKKGLVAKPELSETKRIVFPTGTTTLTSLSGYNDVAIALVLGTTSYTGYEFTLKVMPVDVNKIIASNEVETMTASQKSALENEIVSEFENILKESKNKFTKYEIGFFASTAGYGNDKYAKIKPNLKFVYNWESKAGTKETYALIICQIISPAIINYINALKQLEKKHSQMGLSPKIVTSEEKIEYFIGGKLFISLTNYKKNNADAQMIFREQN